MLRSVSMNNQLSGLKGVLADVADIRHAADLIEWDERVYMPAGGALVHGEMSGTLRRMAHEKFISDAVGEALEIARREVSPLDPSSDEVRLVAVTARDFAKARNVPADFVSEQAHVVSAAQHAWVRARAGSSFAMFQPHLEKVLELKRRYVTFFPPAAHPYDVLLDDFEPGMTTGEVRAVFDVLRPRQVELIRAIGERPQVDAGFFGASFGERAMSGFAVDVITAFGFDWSRGRQDKSVHPFATAISADDVRITTRWVEGEPLSLLFGTMHETGHGLYRAGRQPLAPPDVARRRRLAGRPRIAEPALGEPRRTIAALLGALLPRAAGAVPVATAGGDARPVLPRHQPRAPVVDPRRGRRGDLQPARDAPGRARNRAARRDTGGSRTPRGLADAHG